MMLLALVGCAEEKAKWTYARAMNLGEAGQLDEAIELLQVAMEQSPDDPHIKLSLADMLAENGQGEIGIGLCEGQLEKKPDDVAARHIRSTCFQYLGRFDESLAEYKQCLSGRVSRSEAERNNLAYFRALAKKELSKAAEDIQLAIKKEERKNWGCPYLVPLRVRTVVAAGLISRHIDQREEVLRTLGTKIDLYEAKLAIQSSLIKMLIMEQSKLEFPFDENMENSTLIPRQRQEIQKNCLALLLATRALIHEDLGKTVLADVDRRRLVELGFDFSELADQLPGDPACLAALETGALYLDTRGFVSARRPWQGEVSDSLETAVSLDVEQAPRAASSYWEALGDLDIAVLAAQFNQRAMDSSLYNSPELSAQEMAQLKKLATRMTAVLLYHRMEVHQRGGKTAAADKDQRSIEQLGFQPGSSLF